MAKIIKSAKEELGKDKEVYSAEISSVVKAVDMENRRLQIIGSDETQDRQGDIIMVNGWDIENYKKNPVFLWAHDYSSVPLARTYKLTRKKVPKPHLLFDVQYPSEKLYPFADMILSLYKEKMINASSVGFIAEESEDIETEDSKYDNYWRAPQRFLKQELLELSGCAVPSNPSAVQSAMKSFGIEEDKWLKYLKGEGNMPEIKSKDDIKEELSNNKFEFVDEFKSVQVSVDADIKKLDEEKEEKEEDSKEKETEEELPDEVKEELKDLTEEEKEAIEEEDNKVREAETAMQQDYKIFINDEEVDEYKFSEMEDYIRIDINKDEESLAQPEKDKSSEDVYETIFDKEEEKKSKIGLTEQEARQLRIHFEKMVKAIIDRKRS